MTLSTISLLAKKAVATVITGTIVVFGGGLVLASVAPESEPVADDGIETLADKLEAEAEAEATVTDALEEVEPEEGWTNHGEAVSTAARELCDNGADKAEDATDDDGTEDEDQYANHGECVREVAKSDVGKPEGGAGDEAETETEETETDESGSGKPDHAGKPEGKGKP